MYRYFISGYIKHQEDGETLDGSFNTEICCRKKINSINDIRAIARSIEKMNTLPEKSVTILFYKLFDED